MGNGLMPWALREAVIGHLEAGVRNQSPVKGQRGAGEVLS